MQDTQVPSLGREDPLEEDMVTHCSILAWRIQWMEEPGGLQSKGSQYLTLCHDWSDWADMDTHYYSYLQIKQLRLRAVKLLAMVIQLRPRQDSNPDTLTPEPDILGVKKELIIETASRMGAVFIREVLHCGRVASHESEMKPCRTDQAKQLAHFHQQVVAYLGQFSYCISRSSKDEDGTTIPLWSFKTGQLRGFSPWCWWYDHHPSLGQTWGARALAFCLLPTSRHCSKYLMCCPRRATAG